MLQYTKILFSIFLLDIIFGDEPRIRITMKTPAKPLGKVDRNDNRTVIDYLSKYGYFRGSDNCNYSMSVETYMTGIRKFQHFSGIPNTFGKMDQVTEDQMNLPRYSCGSMDIVDKLGIFPRRKKRYILQGSRWRSGNITYRITKYPSNYSTMMTHVDIDREMKKAFDLWSGSANLRFIYRKRGSIHMNISFLEGHHGDDDDFDGPGGTLAHGYFPVYGGDTHFDDEEEWVRDNNPGTGEHTPIDLLITAAHEIGHALGLSHSRSGASLMAPYYKGYTRGLALHTDDIAAIQRLYGPNTQKGIKANGKPQPCSEKDCQLCDSTKLDTIVYHNGAIFVFSGDFYWKLGSNTAVEDGYPRKITEGWEGLPGNLDASFTWKTGKTFFLKGNKLWKFSEGKLDKRFPKEISKALPGIPNDVNAAFYWPVTETIYFFKGSMYWEFNPKGKPRVKSSFPARIQTDIPGFPEYIDAAIQYTNGRVYVFSERWYYRLNRLEVLLDTSPNPKPFPRLITDWWFNCPKIVPKEPKPKLLEDIKIAGFD